jgi:ketosteroid isomerase-like protein
MLTESVFFKSHRRLAGLILVVLISTIIFNIAAFFNTVDRLNVLSGIGVDPAFFRAPLVIERDLVGGLIFGLGMILAGGCVAGVLFRIGEGQLSSAISFLGLMTGFAVAIILETAGVLGPEISLYPPGTLLPQVLQVQPILLVVLATGFLLAVLVALRRGASWKALLIIVIVFSIAASGMHYYGGTEAVQPTAPPLQLTEEQGEIDRFINAFHVAVSNRSAPKAVSFFTDDAIMVLPDGTLLRNVSMIRGYYEEEFTRYRQYIVYGKASRIEVTDNTATAIYSSGLRAWTLGATQPPYLPYRETFTLVRFGDTWKIETLIMTARGAE